MKFILLSYPILLALVLATSSFASSPNLMHCRDLHLFLGDCHLEPYTLFAETKSQRRFSVRFRYFCDGHKIDLGFQTDGGFVGIKSARGPQEVEMTGRLLKLIDRDPKGTAISSFDTTCVVQILQANADLSQNSIEVLQTLREESALIAGSISTLSLVSEAAGSMLNIIPTADIEGLLWQRDQLRLLLNQLASGDLPPSMRIAYAANLRLLDEMAETSNQVDANLISEKLRKIAASIFHSISKQQIALLNRVEELHLRVTELLIEAGDAQNERHTEIIAFLNGIKQQLKPSKF